MSDYIKEKVQEFREKFGWEEILVCQDCHHPKESHWWSGGGDSRYSGYDACHVPQCDCRCLSEEWDTDKLPIDNTAFESFLTSSLQEMEERTREEERKYATQRYTSYIKQLEKQVEVMTNMLSLKKLSEPIEFFVKSESLLSHKKEEKV